MEVFKKDRIKRKKEREAWVGHVALAVKCLPSK
jgi:hypothetical protein